MRGEQTTAEPDIKTRVLVVNDAPDQLLLVKVLLTKSGYEVVTAKDGREGFAIAQQCRPDMVISDVLMPDVDGVELCSLIRHHPELHRVPVLLVSAQRKDSNSVAAGLNAGADDYLESPYDPMLFLTKVSHVIERKRTEEIIRAADRRALAEYERLLDHLANLALTFGTARDLLSIYRALSDFSLAITPSFGLVICLYDREREVRECAYLIQNGKEVDVQGLGEMPVRSGPASQAIKSGAAVVSNDYRKALGDRKHLLVGFDEDNKFPQSALIAPMTMMGRTIGTVEVQSHDLAAYTREHTTVMQMAANLAANAIENVRLFNLEREKEQQLRQAQKMEAVGRLAGGIAHDFNNLLTAIIGYSDILLEGASGASQSGLNEIKKAGERAATLTRQLLAFSRKQILQPKVLNLNSLVTDLSNLLRRLIGEDIEFILLPNPDLGRINADPGQIEQVLMNLVVNARDAMPRGGRLVIETANVEVDESFVRKHAGAQPGSYVQLSVSDTGTGMDAETQAQIFEPFFTTKEVGKGTGLGLSTVYGIVKQSGGSIWVDSEVGKGSRFSVHFPLVAETEAVVPSTGPKVSAQGAGTIFLVEDEAIVRALTRRILEINGYHVIEAENGEDALKIFAEHQGQIDLMISDIVMPRISGFELADRIRALRPEMRVLFISGYTDEAVSRHGVSRDEVPFLEKPFTPDILARKVREVLKS